MSKILPRSFFDRNPDIVAKELLSKIFVRKIGGLILTGKIVETEAYLSQGDEAAHNFKGKTKRNQSLYKEAGNTYVHSMRQYSLLDIVTEGVDIPSSVLVRGVEPLKGIEYMKEKRGIESIEELANGPSKFCIAFSITGEFDGIDLTKFDAPFYVIDNEDKNSKFSIETSGRIGISRAKDAPLRFWIKGSPFTSRKG